MNLKRWCAKRIGQPANRHYTSTPEFRHNPENEIRGRVKTGVLEKVKSHRGWVVPKGTPVTSIWFLPTRFFVDENPKCVGELCAWKQSQLESAEFAERLSDQACP